MLLDWSRRRQMGSGLWLPNAEVWSGAPLVQSMRFRLWWSNPVAFSTQFDLVWRVYRVSFRKALPLEWDCRIPLRKLSLLWTCIPDAAIVPEDETVLRPVSKTTRNP